MSLNTTNILVTGANGGLGLGICLRLIDDFLKTRNATESLNIIFTTRGARKGSATLSILQAHLRKYHSSPQHERVTFQAENVELTNLLSIRDLARKLVRSELKRLDAVICNAGIGGWIGLDWFAAVPAVLADIRNATVWPAFKLGTVGAVLPPQIQEIAATDPEPPLGEVFCANLFGHYMLIHWLMPLLRACDTPSPGKIVWVSSIEPQSYHFNDADIQGLCTDSPYEHGKRLTDILALTSNQPATEKSVASFMSISSPLRASSEPARQPRSVPIQHVYHPGIVVTSVISLFWIVHQAYLLGIYIARWVGSPWSTVEPYTAAHGATWLALSSEEVIRQAEIEAISPVSATVPATVEKGKIKWGTAINRSGKTTVRPSEVDKWGINGSGAPYAEKWWGGKHGLGRRPGAVEAMPEDVRNLVAQGSRVWEQMEELRQNWERRLEMKDR